MNNVTTIGIDIAKNVFQIYGVDQQGNKVLVKRVKRNNVLKTLAQLPSSTVGMEACGSAHYWGREITQLGHQVKLMSPQYVKPYIKTNKNDYNDAEGICEAVTRPSMRFVPIKSIEQQNINTLHRVREQVVAKRTQTSNHIRGLLAEYGIVAPAGMKSLRTLLTEIIDGQHQAIQGDLHFIFCDLYQELKDLDQRKKMYDQKLDELLKVNSDIRLLSSIPGIGPITASALVYKIGDVGIFKSGHHLSAWCGLVPRQCSSGDRQRLLGISKRGDCYLRSLLIHGARTVIKEAIKKPEQESIYYSWVQGLASSKGVNKAAVALANKNLRIVWRVLQTKEPFNADFARIYQQAA